MEFSSGVLEICTIKLTKYTMYKKYIAEFIGTFALALVVLLASAASSPVLPVPVIAGLTLGLFVFIIGPISGCHINPAVTLALWSIKKISGKDAVGYIVAQFLGALAVVGLAAALSEIRIADTGVLSGRIFIAEALGAFFFNFGIASVVYGKAKDQMSGVVVGGSLLFGLILASGMGSLGILNPAVALALNASTWLYLLAPVVGAACGMQVYKLLVAEK